VIGTGKWNAVCYVTGRRLVNTPTGENMNEIEFQSKLAELMTEISTLPATERKKLEQLADETRQRHERLRATVSSLQESLDYLRLSIKYLVFDLEATRRENGYLRKMLEETSGND
jgi:septal ring factor EnvC (AmiA/AmiB activator)